jgi:hypothetical protein
LDQALQNLRPSRLGKQLELCDRILRTYLTASGPHADQDDALEEQLPVLDLTDVGQLSRHPGNSAQREPIFEVLLISVVADGGRSRFEPLDEQLVIWFWLKL